MATCIEGVSSIYGMTKNRSSLSPLLQAATSFRITGRAGTGRKLPCRSQAGVALDDFRSQAGVALNDFRSQPVALEHDAIKRVAMKQ